MATTKVSELAALTTTDGAEELLINDGGTSKKVTIANLLHDNSIDSDHYVDGSIDLAHMSSESVDEDNLHISNSGSNGQFLSKQSGDSGGLTWATPTSASTATASATGLIKIEDDTDQSVAANAVSATAGRTYGVQLNSSDQAVVNVPWADTNTTYSVTDGELSEINFTSADHTKLNAIEASADVTDATNVTAAGALMDSEVTNLAAVKAFAAADYATAAQGTTADAALPKAGGSMTGNIVMADDTSIGIADDAERIEFDGAGDISVLGANIGVGISNPSVQLANFAGTGTNVGASGINWNSSEASKYVAQFRNGADPAWGISVKLGIAAPDATDKYIDFIDDDGVIQASLTGTGEAGGGLGIQIAGTERMKIAENGQAEFANTVTAKTDTDTSNSGTVDLNFATNQNFVLTLTGNITSLTASNEKVGQSGFITFIQDGTGSRTVSLHGDYETAGGAGLTLTSTASATDIVPYVVAAASRILLGTPQLAFS